MIFRKIKIIMHTMVYKITKEEIVDMFEDQELIEFVIVEMPTKDLLVHVKSADGKNN